MKFTAKEDFRSGHTTFEAGNTYSSEKHGVSEDQIKRWHANGWCEVEGWDPAPERTPGAQRIAPQNGKLKAKE